MADRHAPELNVTTESIPEGEIVSPAGDVDLSGSPVLRNELRKVQQKRPKRIIVELSQVGYMDSTGLATLVEAMQQGRKFGTRIVLCALSDRVRSINWRATARRGSLVVNERHPERNADVVIFLDSLAEARAAAEGTLEQAVRTAATLATRFLERRDRVGDDVYVPAVRGKVLRERRGASRAGERLGREEVGDEQEPLPPRFRHAADDTV